jgi:hypothetical protein
MDINQSKNVYLNQVMEQKAQVECDLKAQRIAPVPISRSRSQSSSQTPDVPYANNKVRITGWWPFQNVIVPPNVYVVHTRRGYKEPVNMGLGLSFRFDPVNDAFLIVPATMQTILINANCICKEKQGLVVQGYVQWIINDIKIAYTKLDFSDVYDPMRVVNVQLREQAEAAIKDKVATMSIDDVLADKQPIIEELTSRIRQVAEGEGQDKGLGLRIVTVQIKEAVVGSSEVWEALQRPFRSERSKEARLVVLANDSIIKEKESEAEKISEKLRIETKQEIAQLQARTESENFNEEQAELIRRAAVKAETLKKSEEIAQLEAKTEAEKFDRQQEELARRAAIEGESLKKKLEHEKAKIEHEAQLERLKLEKELILEQMNLDAKNRQMEKEIELFAAKRRAESELSEVALQEHLINRLPEIAEKMPKPGETKTISFGNISPVQDFIEQIKSIIKPDNDKKTVCKDSL